MVSQLSRLLDTISSRQEDHTAPPPRLETIAVLALPGEVVYLQGGDHLALAAITPNDDQGLFYFSLFDDLHDDVIDVFDTNKRSVLCLSATILVLELRGLVVVTKAIQVLGEGRVDALLKTYPCL